MQTFSKENLSIRRTTKGKLPSLPFWQLKNDILGKQYELSVAFIGRNEARELNKTHRGKDYATNILSFPLSKKSGELVVSLEKVRRDAKEFGKPYEQFLGFLVIHGMLHLKGFAHGSKMESLERKFCKKFRF